LRLNNACFFTEAPLDHVFINLADGVGIHVHDVVTPAEILEGVFGQYQLDKQLGVANREIKFNEFFAGITAQSDISCELIERGLIA
tara:strand:+ start:92 stop:349 length:258 start_codon:yes stop_codon:yes gene_type:complete